MHRRFLGLSILVALGILGLSLVVPGCNSEPSQEAYLYVVTPLTGEMASRGQEIVGGVRLRANEFNKQGGILGRKVVVRALDDGGDGDLAVEAAQQIAEAVKKGEPVLGVIGHYNSGATSPALDAVYKNLDVVVITPGSSNPTLTQKGYKNFFRVVSTDDIQGPVDARQALGMGWKKIVVMHTDNLYALGLASAFSEELKKQGVPPVTDIQMKYNNLGVYLQELPGNVQKALDAKPDSIFFAGDYPEAIPLVEALREAGYQGSIMTGDSVVEYEFIDTLGSKAEGVYLSNIQPEMEAVATMAWKDNYRALEKCSPGMTSIMGDAAAQVLLEGVKKANMMRGSAVADALRQMKTKTIIGDWASDANGDMQDRKIYMYQVRNGQFAQVGEER